MQQVPALASAIRQHRITTVANSQKSNVETQDDLPQHNLPALTSPFVGREKELAALDELLADSTLHLITIRVVAEIEEKG